MHTFRIALFMPMLTVLPLLSSCSKVESASFDDSVRACSLFDISESDINEQPKNLAEFGRVLSQTGEGDTVAVDFITENPLRDDDIPPPGVPARNEPGEDNPTCTRETSGGSQINR